MKSVCRWRQPGQDSTAKYGHAKHFDILNLDFLKSFIFDTFLAHFSNKFALDFNCIIPLIETDSLPKHFDVKGETSLPAQLPTLLHEDLHCSPHGSISLTPVQTGLLQIVTGTPASNFRFINVSEPVNRLLMTGSPQVLHHKHLSTSHNQPLSATKPLS